MASRSTQPYRRGNRHQGRALAAMLAGKPAYMPNPMDVTRQAQRSARRRRGALGIAARRRRG